ncbi:MAG: DUF1569 domain-containing protein [Gemmatimonadaceae bacterium]
MRTLLDRATADDVQARLRRLQPAQQSLWGRMTVAQAMAHCSVGLEMGLGDLRAPRMLIGRILGQVIRRLALGNDRPMRRNSPTAPDLVVSDERDFERERVRLAGLIERFAAGGAAGCTTHPHPFFGRLTPDQWGELMYKHLDHHLRQFGA